MLITPSFKSKYWLSFGDGTHYRKDLYAMRFGRGLTFDQASLYFLIWRRREGTPYLPAAKEKVRTPDFSCVLGEDAFFSWN